MACQLETLLTAATCDIQYCADCGMIHLMMGSMTLRLTTEHFQEFSQDLNKGVMQLKMSTLSTDGFRPDNVTTLHS